MWLTGKRWKHIEAEWNEMYHGAWWLQTEPMTCRLCSSKSLSEPMIAKEQSIRLRARTQGVKTEWAWINRFEDAFIIANSSPLGQFGGWFDILGTCSPMKKFDSWLNFYWNLFLRVQMIKISIGSGNGLVPSDNKPLTSIHDDPVRWRIMWQ